MSQISQNIQNINREETKETFAPNRDVPGSKANFDEKKEFFEHLKDTDENNEFGGSSVGNEQGNFERQSGSIGSQGNLKTGTPGGSNLMSNVPSGTSVSKDSSCTKDTTCPKDSKCDTSESKLSTSSNIPNPPPQPELNDKGEIKNTNTYGQGISNNIPPGTSLNEKKDTNLDTSDWTGSNQQFGRDLSGEQDLYKKGEWNKGELSAGKHWNEDNQPSSDKKLNERDSSSEKNWDKKESFEKNLSKRESGKDWDKKESSDENWGNRESSSDKDLNERDFSSDKNLNERDSSSDKNWNERESGKDWGNKDSSSSDKGFSGSESFNKDK